MLTPYIKRIFVAGLNGETSKKSILSFFNEIYPGCTRVDLPVQKDQPNISKGFAILFLENENDYNKILSKKDFLIEGRLVHARPFKTGNDLTKFKEKFNKRKLYVSKIPKNWGNDMLLSCFLRFGGIEDCFIINDPITGTSQGFGFVIFFDLEPVRKILTKGSVSFNGVQLSCTKAQSLEERKVSVSQTSSSAFYKNVKVPYKKINAVKSQEKGTFSNFLRLFGLNCDQGARNSQVQNGLSNGYDLQQNQHSSEFNSQDFLNLETQRKERGRLEQEVSRQQSFGGFCCPVERPSQKKDSRKNVSHWEKPTSSTYHRYSKPSYRHHGVNIKQKWIKKRKNSSHKKSL